MTPTLLAMQGLSFTQYLFPGPYCKASRGLRLSQEILLFGLTNTIIHQIKIIPTLTPETLIRIIEIILVLTVIIR